MRAMPHARPLEPESWLVLPPMHARLGARWLVPIRECVIAVPLCQRLASSSPLLFQRIRKHAANILQPPIDLLRDTVRRPDAAHTDDLPHSLIHVMDDAALGHAETIDRELELRVRAIQQLSQIGIGEIDDYRIR